MSERAHTHLWNDMPFEERERLMPYMIECQILHLEQAKIQIKRGHRRTMDSINSHIRNLKEELARTKRKALQEPPQ